MGLGREHNMTSPVVDDTQQLADRLGVPLETWLEIFGNGWFESADEPWHDFDSDPNGGGGFPATPWHIKSDPPQLMVRVFNGHLFIARPEGVWSGHRLTFQPADQCDIPVWELLETGPSAVARLLKARRRRFRWCPVCWQHTPPEQIMGPECMGCFEGEF